MVQRPNWLSFRRFAAVTTALTLSLITLGVYTSATGSGLACQAQWPLCSDQLIPALSINPDFIEWFHRVVAMITGFFILGTAGWAWQRGDRRTTLAAVGAVVLLPLQISIGAITVTLNGLLPWGYSAPTHAAHLIVALSIFTLLSLTTIYGYRDHHSRPPRPRSRRTLGVALAALLVSGLFSRGVPLLQYSPGAQAWYYASSLVAVVALLATIHWLDGVDPLGRRLAGVAFGVLLATMLIGRDLIIYTPTVQLLNFGLYLALLGVVAAGLWRLVDTDTPSTATRLGSEQSE
ncbi:COX15/CtaA family protein [Halonotius roseus]|uniref:Cytochrome oxidase assembly protein n=1 Tax=Halonotius roseus TaxID=2511997 RepID=A0A544QN85_9EURY|nr:COX15/CtaA family protein [Halonotius roseus]TQQ80372.1 cytochrome oxidase assembly protein [Halonotius roseus]